MKVGRLDESQRTESDAAATTPNSRRLLVTVCTYNERENLAKLIEGVSKAAPDADILVLDDLSPDGTGELADELKNSYPRLNVIHRGGTRGLGRAMVEGFQFGIKQGYDLLVNLDADLSHDPAAIPSLVAAIDEADVVIGSRYVPGGEIRGWGPRRHFMSRGINFYSRVALGLSSRDISGSFRCYRVSTLAKIDFDQIISHGYAFMEEIIFRCRQTGARIVERPIIFLDREEGESKINLAECCRAVVNIATLCLERRKTQRKSTAKDSPAEVPSDPSVTTVKS
ncbi:polyprenol monophosphomannose synthase [Stratiformator vulcanicus]|uniref:Undecaprenyl-phosphate mannosyltransferase n=1 Tax=Stratiformator vulcanicus TaxID=2527980 RepID=A0A517R291_9PLAN|nr:polyprenol monophosphomannose synthase [Stratiformator vulcanicus]QDT37996.1 Undecaprenyl-phosphate mannosyltransferase [Stratiformator vulcanicus]